MKTNIELISLLVNDLENSIEKNMKQMNKGSYINGTAYLNKDYGKTALVRKITLIRQELLNLKEIIEGQ